MHLIENTKPIMQLMHKIKKVICTIPIMQLMHEIKKEICTSGAFNELSCI